MAGLLVCAIDGTITSVADSAANLAVYSTQRGGRNGDSGYSMLSGSLRAGMLLLADRNFAAVFLAAQIAGAKADFLIRVRTGTSAPKLPVLRRLPERLLAVPLRRRPGPGHRRRDHDRDQRRAIPGRLPLITTLLDAARYPAGDLAVLYHER